MDQQQIIITIAFCFLFFMLATVLIGVYIFKKYGSPIPRMFKEFDKKMWMTLGLGIVFFGSYALLVYIGSWILDSSNVFWYFYSYTSQAIYSGLSLFAFVTLSIYGVRLIIKRLYQIKKETKR